MMMIQVGNAYVQKGAISSISSNVAECNGRESNRSNARRRCNMDDTSNTINISKMDKMSKTSNSIDMSETSNMGEGGYSEQYCTSLMYECSLQLFAHLKLAGNLNWNSHLITFPLNVLVGHGAVGISITQNTASKDIVFSCIGSFMMRFSDDAHPFTTTGRWL